MGRAPRNPAQANVTRKALVLAACLMLALSGLYLAQGILQHDEQLAESIRAEERTIDATVRDLERYVYEAYVPRLRFIVEHEPAVTRSFAARDRAALLAAAAPRYAGLRDENRAFHAWDFNLPDGTVFLRVQDPGAFGDNIGATRPIVRAVHERRRPAAGYDIGRHGAMYWVAQPVFQGERYLGATEFGIETSQLMDAMRSRFGAEVALLVRAEQWRKAALVEEGYRAAGDHVLIAAGDSAFLRIPDAQLFAAGKDQRVRLPGRDLILHRCAVLADFSGAPVGSLLVLQDVTARLGRRRTYIAAAALGTAALLAICFGLLTASFRTLIGRLETYALDTSRAKEEIERSRDWLGIRIQERTADIRTANRTLEEQVAELGRMGRELRAAHERLLLVLDGLDAIVYVADMATHEVLFANRYATGLLGELVGKRCWETIQSGQRGPCPFCTNARLLGPDGEPAGTNSWEFRNAALGRWLAIQERAIRWSDGRLVRLAIATDTTERHEAEERLRASLREKEVLLKEIHHRVKNNMQIVSSLLSLQADASGGATGPRQLRDSQARIQAMGLLHEKLYRSGDLSRIDLVDYLASLVERLVASGAPPGSGVRGSVAGDRVLLGIETAVPCGLIVNELVTNALKHAFPGGRAGAVRVEVSRSADPGGGEDAFEIAVSDDGVGLPAEVVPEQARTLGLQLVAMLAEKQLHGTLAVERAGGTRFAVRFRELRYPSRT